LERCSREIFIMVRFLSKSFALSLATLMASSPVLALPFNSDMVNNQLRAGAIMRPLPEGSVAVGSLPGHLGNRDEALALTNPLKSDKVSPLSGERLFAANCFPCHGDITQKTWQPGPVGQKINALVAGKPPDLTSAYYKAQPDGTFYAAMHFGFGLMPNVGWKLSPTEHWDIINYIRQVQASK
jgi:mono/diheme cytochrome c family protein